VGPYKFWQTEEKCNITWNENGTITYRQLKHWYHNNTQESRSLQDKITSISPTAVVRKSFFQLLVFVSERNGSYGFDGVFNLGTGKNSTFGKLYSWNHWTKTPFYDDPCSRIAESTGQFFGQNLGEDFIALFSSDIRRTLFLKYVGKKKVHNIVGNKYILEDLMLDNGTIYSQNKCYCSGECVPSGVFNISSIRNGGPVFISLPHLHRADPYYLNSVEGMRPDRNKHETSIIVEPTTGIPLEVDAKGQANFLVQPVPGIS
ncbi:CD36 domain containing protein, partial [Asbolus verrucosus]